MTLTELAALGARMRAAQRLYFRTRSQVVLQESKALELEFDRAVERVLGKQQGLWGD